MTIFKIVSIVRHLDQETSKFIIFNKHVTLSARPMRMWKYFFFYTKHSSESLVWQTPWLTLAIKL